MADEDVPLTNRALEAFVKRMQKHEKNAIAGAMVIYTTDGGATFGATWIHPDSENPGGLDPNIALLDIVEEGIAIRRAQLKKESTAN